MSNQVSAEQVRRFLAGQEVAVKPPSDENPHPPQTDPVTVNLGDPSQGPAQEPGPLRETPARINTGAPSPHTDLELPSMGNEVTWSYEDPVLKEVEVTDEDKALYLKAALNDRTVELPIRLLNDTMTVVCRSLSNFEYEVVFRAIHKAQEAGLITAEAQQISYIQWFCSCMQVVSVNGSQLNPPRFQSSADINECAEAVMESHRQRYRDMDAVRWALSLTAARVFECKLKVCNDNLANLDFWLPAGGA